MTLVRVDGVEIEVRVAGSGPPLLLLHGFTGSGDTWSPHLPALARIRRTIVVDLLGHGGSEAAPEPARYAVERQAADLGALLRTLDAVPADVLGYSMGARIALRLAIDDPKAVCRLVLESPSAGIEDPAERARRRETDERLARLVETEGTEAFVDRWESQPLFASHARLAPAVRAGQRRERLANRAVALAASLRGAGQGAMHPLHDRLGTIVAPTLAIAGELDVVGRERAEVVAALMPVARLALVEGAGHTPHFERPAAFRRLVTSFLVEPVPAPGATRVSSATH